jgi:hypothetical protein
VMQPAAAQKQKRGTKQPPHSHALIAPPAVKIYIIILMRGPHLQGIG